MESQNILLITIDSLRQDFLGTTVNGRSISPRIDGLANDGLQFPQAVANGSNTPSSFPSILTSTYPLMYGGYRYLDDERPFVAGTFRNAGFETVAYHSNPHLGPDMNYDQGFERFNDQGSSDDRSEIGILNRTKNAVEQRIDRDSVLYGVLRRAWHIFSLTTDTAAYADAEEISESATAWIDERDADRPFFTWLHYMDVHYPFMPPEEHLEALNIDPPSKRRIAKLNGLMHEEPDQITDTDREQLLDLYRAEIHYADAQIGRVLDRLESAKELENTLVVVTGDHGEAFGEHGRYGHHPFLYDELLRVPLVMNGPGIEAGKTVDEQVSLVDIGPTLYNLIGIDIPDTVQGESLVPLIDPDSGKQNERIALSTALGGETLATRTSKWKCFWRVRDEQVELYDLENDPEETRDVSEQYPDVVERFKSELESHLEDADATDIDLPDPTVSDEAQGRLRDLGYVE